MSSLVSKSGTNKIARAPKYNFDILACHCLLFDLNKCKCVINKGLDIPGHAASK